MDDWRSGAACLGVDPELFFPVGNGVLAVAQAERAKEWCADCSVVEKCLAWAISTRQESGVWGGMSEVERAAFVRREQRTRDRYAHLAEVRARWAEVVSPSPAPQPVVPGGGGGRVVVAGEEPVPTSCRSSSELDPVEAALRHEVRSPWSSAEESRARRHALVVSSRRRPDWGTGVSRVASWQP